MANSLGVDGMRYALGSSRDVPPDIYEMLPSCVPATHLGALGDELDARALGKLVDHGSALWAGRDNELSKGHLQESPGHGGDKGA